MKYFLKMTFLLFIGLTTMSFSTPKKKVQVICQLEFASDKDSLSLFQFDGLGFQLVDKVGNIDQKFVFSVPKSKPSFYYVGTDTRNIKSIILGSEKKVVVNGNIKKMPKITFQSEMNNNYNQMMSQAKMLKSKGINARSQLVRLLQQNKDISEITKKLAEIDNQKTTLLEETKKKSAYLGNIASLYTYLSFQNHQEKYKQEIEYFGNEYFHFVDFSQDDFNRTATVYDAIQKFVIMLSNTRGLPIAQLEGYVDKLLNRIPKKTKAYKMGLGGVIGALGQKNHPSYVKYAKKFLDLYENDGSKNTQNLKKQFQVMQNLVVGGIAPDFTMKTPDGKDIRLKDLRGKYILLDFWASWCGPCRRENPNVVKMYHEYKDKGFEILSVSLDKSKSRWESAIEADHLDWLHVSDLKYWNNRVAKMYNVHSVPYQILLDPEGKIIATNMRSSTPTNSLEYHLKRIFK